MINRDKRRYGDLGTHGLKHRFREQVEGRNGPGTPEWDTHDQAIRDQQRGLRDRLNESNSQNCGDRVPLPAEAWKWATQPAPQPSEWKGSAQESAQRASKSPVDLKYWQEVTGLTGAALILYLIISEGSWLFPARNLVPVP